MEKEFSIDLSNYDLDNMGQTAQFEPQQESWPQTIGRNVARVAANLPDPFRAGREYGKERARGELESAGYEGPALEKGTPTTVEEYLKQKHEGTEYLKPQGMTEKWIDRSVRNLPFMIGGGPLATAAKTAGVSAVGQAAEEMGFGEFGQAVAEVMASLGPTFTKGISANRLLTDKQIAKNLNPEPGQRKLPVIVHKLQTQESKLYDEAEKIGSGIHIPGKGLLADLSKESARLNSEAPFVAGPARARVEEALKTVEKLFPSTGTTVPVNAAKAVKAKQSINALIGKTHDVHEKAYLRRIAGYIDSNIIREAASRNANFGETLDKANKLHGVLAKSREADELIKEAANEAFRFAPGGGALKKVLKSGSNFLWQPFAGKLGGARPGALKLAWQNPEARAIYGDVTRAALDNNKELLTKKLSELATVLVPANESKKQSTINLGDYDWD